MKIARLEGEKAFDMREGRRNFTSINACSPHNGRNLLWLKYGHLWINVRTEFVAHHRKCKATPLTDNFDDFSGVDFEVYLAGLLKKLGFEEVSGTPTTGDQGADLIATKDGRRIAIQAKRYKGVVGNGAVQEIVAALKFYKADEGWVITTGTFSQSARALAQANDIRLVDGFSLRKLQLN